MDLKYTQCKIFICSIFLCCV